MTLPVRRWPLFLSPVQKGKAVADILPLLGDRRSGDTRHVSGLRFPPPPPVEMIFCSPRRRFPLPKGMGLSTPRRKVSLSLFTSKEDVPFSLFRCQRPLCRVECYGPMFIYIFPPRCTKSPFSSHPLPTGSGKGHFCRNGG